MFTCLQYFQTPLKFKEYVVARRFHNAPYPGIKKKLFCYICKSPDHDECTNVLVISPFPLFHVFLPVLFLLFLFQLTPFS